MVQPAAGCFANTQAFVSPAMSTRTLRWMAAGIISALFLLSFHLASHRIIQVDEAQNMFMARVIQSGQTDLYFVNPALFLLGPLGWIAGAVTSAHDAFFGGRMLFLGVFWLNIFLLVKCTGVSLRTEMDCWSQSQPQPWHPCGTMDSRSAMTICC